VGAAAAVNREVLHDVDVGDALAEMRGDALARFHHALQEQQSLAPALAVNLPLAHLPGRDADGDVFERAAEAATGVALEVGVDEHGIIVQQVLAHGDFGQVHPRRVGRTAWKRRDYPAQFLLDSLAACFPIVAVPPSSRRHSYQIAVALIWKKWERRPFAGRHE